jgi:tRNA(Arg) A34 adenosine deaminase TadA
MVIYGGRFYMNEYMKIAKELSDDNLKTNVGGPFGACIVKDGIIIGKGSNHVLAHNDPTAHAEVMAIRDACKNINSYDLSGAELYTSCYPCPMCLSAIIWANIKVVYYGNTQKDAADIGFRDDFIYKYIDKLSNNKKDDKTLKLECLNREEAIKVFNRFKEDKNKEMY